MMEHPSAEALGQRAGRPVPTPTSAAGNAPSLVGEDKPKSATLPTPGPSWPYGTGWR